MVCRSSQPVAVPIEWHMKSRPNYSGHFKGLQAASIAWYEGISPRDSQPIPIGGTIPGGHVTELMTGITNKCIFFSRNRLGYICRKCHSPVFLKVVSLVSSKHCCRYWPHFPRIKMLMSYWAVSLKSCHINTLRPRLNGRHFAGNIFKCIFLYLNTTYHLHTFNSARNAMRLSLCANSLIYRSKCCF